MAYRVFVGGVPAWADHGLVKQWCWHNSLQWPDHVQIVRRWSGETQIVCFLCFDNYTAAATALDRLKNIGFEGNRISVKWSRDSMPHPAAPKKHNNTEATGAATQTAPTLVATGAKPELAATGAATASTSTATGSTGSGTIGAAPSSGANAVCEEKEKIEAKTEVKLPEPPQEDVQPLLSVRLEGDSTPQAHTPTEPGWSPTEAPTTQSPTSPAISECPTVVVPEGQEDILRTSQELNQAHAELLEIKKELKEEEDT